MTVIEQDYNWSQPLTKRRETRYLVLHHEAASGSTAQQIHEYHLKKGWSGIAYHYYVRKSGLVYRGRPEDTAGAHTQGYNNVSIGICFEGNFESEVMFAQQYAAGKALILDILKRYPGIQIVGHKELNATACPGAKFPLNDYKHLKVEEDEDEVKRYNSIGEMPGYAQKDMAELCDKGILKGRGTAKDGNGYPADLDLSEDMIRNLILCKRMIEGEKK